VDESGALQPVQCRVDRAGGQVEGALAALAQRFDDRVAVLVTVLEHREQQCVEVALENLGPHA
jgi:hypothetical protein